MNQFRLMRACRNTIVASGLWLLLTLVLGAASWAQAVQDLQFGDEQLAAVSGVKALVVRTDGEEKDSWQTADTPIDYTILALCTAEQTYVTSGEPRYFKFTLADAGDLFVTVQKVESTFGASVQLKQGDTVIASANEAGDTILTVNDAPAGEYTLAISPSADGNVVVRACRNLPEVKRGELFVGTIQHNNGLDWSQMDVPENTTSLDFTVETVGNISDLDVWRGSIGSGEHWSARQLFNPPVRLKIDSPPAGRYYLRVYDHGVITGSQVRDYSIMAEASQPTPVIGCSANAETWDANADFSATSNPNGAWSYGWTATLGSPLHLYPSTNPSNTSAWWDPAIERMGAPSFWKNTSASTQFGVAPGETSLHPGPNNEFSVLRWTAPSASDCTVNAQFLAGHDGDTDAYVLKNGATIFSAETTNINPSFGQTIRLSAGDTLDFAVGSKGSYYSDNTPVSVTIAAKPLLYLAMDVDTRFAQVGSQLTYTLTVRNDMQADLSSVTVEDVLPQELALVEGSISNSGTYDAVAHKITWNVGGLAADGVPMQLQFRAVILGGDTIVNTATATATELSSPATACATTRIVGPVILSVSPNQGGNSGLVTLTITGTGLDPAAQAKLVKTGEADITASYVTGLADGTCLTATFVLNGKTPGLWDVVVTNPGGQIAALPAGFVIVAGGEAKLWVEVVGNGLVRAGRNATYQIRYGNAGTVDAGNTVIAVQLPDYVQNVAASPPGVFAHPESPAMELWFEDTVPAKSEASKTLAVTIPSGLADGTPFVVSADIGRSTPEIRDGFCLNSDNISPGIPSPEVGGDCEPPGTVVVEETRIRTQRYPLAPISQPNGDGSCALTLRCRTWITNERRECTIVCGVGLNPPPHWNWISKSCGDWRFVSSNGTLEEKTLTVPCDLACTLNPESCPGGDDMHGQVGTSSDPNDKSGPVGYDPHGTTAGQERRFISSDVTPGYMIYFENLETATAAAQEVLITDQLDPNLDWSTFALDTMQIGAHIVSVPEDSQSYSTEVDLRPEMPAVVQVTCTFDQATGLARWLFRGTDPVSGELADFLPPNTDAVDPQGRGWVSYSVKPVAVLPSGTEIRNKATIDFEVDVPPEPMDTPEWLNTIDSVAPTSAMGTRSARGAGDHPISWAGTDDSNGSGVKDYTIYVSDNGAPYAPWLTNTIDTSAVFTGQYGHTYNFYCRSRDNVGNIEQPPLAPQYTTQIGTRPANWTGLAMVSVPLIPDDPDPKQIAAFDASLWACYFPNLGQYAVYSNDPGQLTWFIPADKTPGRGFWARFTDGAVVPRGTIPAQDQPMTIRLLVGWNLVGNPFLSAVKWDLNAIEVQEPGAAATSLRNARTVVANYAWGWRQNLSDPYKGSYYLVYDSAIKPGVNDSLQPWEGYWIKAYRECDLIIPAP